MEQEKDPIDNLTEKTFRLLGAIQELDQQDPESHKKFGEALMAQYHSILPFMMKK